MGVKVTNNAYGTISAGISSTDTTITLDSGQGARFPTLGAGDYFYGTLVDTSNTTEIVKVTARSSDSMTVVRGQDNTTASAFAIGDRFELRPTAALFEAINLTEGGTASGALTIDEDGATVLTVDRATSNGTIIDVQKDGASVGTIGVTGDDIYVNGANNQVKIWINGSSRYDFDASQFYATTDNARNLGTSSYRWNKLYLGGGVYLGGTGSANYLDDYEEGYHDSTIYIGGSVYTGTVNNRRLRYVKIGSVVHCTGRIYIAGGLPTGGNSSNVFEFSLPFASPSGVEYETSNEFQNIRFNDGYTFRLNAGTSIVKMQNDGTQTGMDVSSPHLNVSFTYFTNS